MQTLWLPTAYTNRKHSSVWLGPADGRRFRLRLHLSVTDHVRGANLVGFLVGHFKLEVADFLVRHLKQPLRACLISTSNSRQFRGLGLLRDLGIVASETLSVFTQMMLRRSRSFKAFFHMLPLSKPFVRACSLTMHASPPSRNAR